MGILTLKREKQDSESDQRKLYQIKEIDYSLLTYSKKFVVIGIFKGL